MKSILVVGDQESVEFASRVYGDLAPITFASSVREAETLIAKSRPTIAIGTLAADESRYINLLPLLVEQRVKTVVIDCPATVLNDESLNVAKAYAIDLGIAAWWDMRRALTKEGIEAAEKEIRAIVQNLLDDNAPNESPAAS